jgi:hypothetical protein
VDDCFLDLGLREPVRLGESEVVGKLFEAAGGDEAGGDDEDTNALSDPIVVPTVDYLIVEGICSYHPEIAHYDRYKIWVDTPIEVSARAWPGARQG